MQAFKENTDSVHRIDPDSKGAIASRFNELVNSLESGEDQEVQDQLKKFSSFGSSGCYWFTSR